MQEALDNDIFDFYRYLFDQISYIFRDIPDPHFSALVARIIYKYYHTFLKYLMDLIYENGLFKQQMEVVAKKSMNLAIPLRNLIKEELEPLLRKYGIIDCLTTLESLLANTKFR